MVTWTQVAPDFEPDGALLDVYFYSTSLADWDAFLKFLQERELRMRFLIDGEDSPLPSTARDVFDIRERASPLLKILLRRATINCHFFCEDEIELDLDPREWSEENWSDLLDFLRDSSRLLGRAAIVCHENSPEFRFLEYDLVQDNWKFLKVAAV